MTASRVIAFAILLACIGIVTIASIEPIAGNMMVQGMKDQRMIISCPANMDCKAMMSMNASMEQPLTGYCPANMTCMMMMKPMNETEQNKSMMQSGRMMPKEPWGNPEMEGCGKEAIGMMNEKNGSWKNEKWNETKAIEIRKFGSGFAMSGNHNHVIMMNIEGKMKPDFADIKKLISDNKTLGQIKSEIKAKMSADISAASYNGSLHLNQSNYNLLNIKLTFSGNNSSTINADVAGPKLNFTDKPTAVVGHITVTTSRQDNSTIGEGTLTMNSDQYSGQYKILIEMNRGMGEHNGMKSCAFGGMDQKGERFGMNKEMGKPQTENKMSQKA
jgi:hypothetical protein